MHLGNLLELADILAITQSHRVEFVKQREYVQRAYAEFCALFSLQYRLKVDSDGEQLDPMAHLFEPSMIHLAVTLINHKEHVKMLDESFSSTKLRKALITHFKTYRNHLLKRFEKQLKDTSESHIYTYEWIGPSFTVVKANDWVPGEQLTSPTAPINYFNLT